MLIDATSPTAEPAAAAPIPATLAAGFLAALASALLLALSFPPWDLGWLAWVALVPLFVGIDRVGEKAAVALGLVTGLGWMSISLSWFYGIFGASAGILHAIQAGFLALYAGLVVLGVRRWGHGFLVWGAPALWVVGEHFRSELWPLRNGWLGLGYSQHASLGLLQVASVTGIYGLSFLVVLVNGAAAAAVLALAVRRRGAVLAGLIAGVLGVEGVGRLALSEAEAEAKVRVACVQGEGIAASMFATAIRKAAERAPAPELYVLPEYATFNRMSQGCEHLEVFGGEARRLGAYVLFGATESCAGDGPSGLALSGGASGAQGAFRNTAFLLGPDAEIAGRQAKSQPVQFFDDGLPAASQEALPTPWGGLGVLICYDLDYPALARNLTLRGAGLLAAPTMDARHWGPVQHAQHVAMAPLRAVENRRFVVRTGSSGVTAIFDPWGRVAARLDSDANGAVLRGEVAFRSDTSLYVRYGWVFPWLCWGAAGCMAVVGLPARKRA